MTNWTSQIDSITEDFLTVFGTLSHEHLNWKPDTQTWSIAQNMEHLIIINESYFPIFESLKEGTYKKPFLANFGFLVSFFGKTILNSVNPDRKTKMKTFPIWEPTQSDFKDDILDKFTHSQNELKKHMESCMAFIKKGTIIASPANKNIVYKLETAFDIIVTHEKRHLEQAKEVLQGLRDD